MKISTQLMLTYLILLTAFVSFASAAAYESNDIRGPVYNGTNLESILSNAGGNIGMDGTNFAAFFYDIDNNITTETLLIKNGKGNVIGKDGLVYSTTIASTHFEYKPWGNYQIISLFGEKYVPIKPNDASEFTRLVLDSDDKYSLKTGEILNLGQGFKLEAKQIDVDGEKVWLELDKDGQYVGDEIVSVAGSEDGNWTCELDNILGEDDIPVFKVHVNQVFQGGAESIAQIEGLWLIDYTNAGEIKFDSEFSKLNDVLIGPTLTITNEDPITLTKGLDVEIGEGIYFRIANDANALRFYAFKHITTPGWVKVRGQVATGAATWTAFNFAGFYYNINDNLQTESLAVKSLNGRVIPENNLVYNTTIRNVHYQFKNFNGTYPVLGLFGEEYIPIKPNDASKLARLVLGSDDKYNLETGEYLDLGQGYSLQVKQVDVDGEKVWLEFDKDGQYVDDAIVSTDSGNDIWTCELDNILGEYDIPVFKVHVNQVFQSAVDGIAQIEGLWLIDYANASEIRSDDEFGKLNNVSVNGPTLNISNDDPITLTRGLDIEIGQGIYFRVADSDTLRYYPYIERYIGSTVPQPILVNGTNETATLEEKIPAPGENIVTSQKEPYTVPNTITNITGSGTADTIEINSLVIKKLII